MGGLSAGRPIPFLPVRRCCHATGNRTRRWLKRVLPAVVSVEVQGKGVRGASRFEDIDPGFGSGFLIDPSGVIVTNNHVVREATAVEITLHDGRKFTSKDIRRDSKADLAVIRIDAKEPLPFLEFGDSDAMEVGDRVLAVGSPFGLTSSVTQGIVSGKSRNLNLNLHEDFLQTDAAMNPGNSGGPLVNMEEGHRPHLGDQDARSGGFQGVGLAVSSNIASTIAEQLVKNGVVRRPYVGVSVVDLDEAAAKQLKASRAGGGGERGRRQVARAEGEHRCLRHHHQGEWLRHPHGSRHAAGNSRRFRSESRLMSS